MAGHAAAFRAGPRTHGGRGGRLEAPFDAATFLARKQQQQQQQQQQSPSGSGPWRVETFMDGGFVVLPEELRPSTAAGNDGPPPDRIELTFGTLHEFPAGSPLLRAVTLAYTNCGQDVEWSLEEYSPSKE